MRSRPLHSVKRTDEKCIQNFNRKPRQRRLLEDLCSDEKIILKWIVDEQGKKMWSGFDWLGQDPVACLKTLKQLVSFG
jgi:hypothetical protein